jgi:hypothetical protein
MAGLEASMTVNKALCTENTRFAKKTWPQIGAAHIQTLKSLTDRYKFSVRSGDVILLENRWYVTHTGLIRLARRSRCAGIHAEAAQALSEPARCRWAFKATVYKSRNCKGFMGFGDADPGNVSPFNRALRKAYGIGICSVEEIGSFVEPAPSSRESKKVPPQPVNGKNGNYGGPKVRDRLCQLIRQHQLDAHLVKSYAVDFCGTKSLREATREQVEAFVTHLADWAEKDRNALLCQLNSYPVNKEGAA